MQFPDKISQGGLVPDKVAFKPEFIETAGAIDFAWGSKTSDLFTAFITFLYLDFIGAWPYGSLHCLAAVLHTFNCTVQRGWSLCAPPSLPCAFSSRLHAPPSAPHNKRNSFACACSLA